MPIKIHNIPDQDGYFVSEDGRIFKEKLPTLGVNGYRQTGFRRGDRRRYIHEIVLTTFKGGRPDNFDASHVDGNRLNNHKDNLVWESRKDNMARTHEHKSLTQAKLTEDRVLEIRDAVFWGHGFYESLARFYRVSATTIRDIRNRKTWRHI